MKVEHIQTPALLVNLDAMESNMVRMSTFFANRPAKLRPHFKNHKVPALAKRQLRAGAIGMTCATLREAEVLVRSGIREVLIANEIVGDTKPEQLAELSQEAPIIVAIDSRTGVMDLARAQRNRKAKIAVVVDIDIGMQRCGVPPGVTAVALAQLALREGLLFAGVMGYDGHLQSLPPTPERNQAILAGSKLLVHTASLLLDAGIAVPVISTGGTGTYAVSGDYEGITEIQAGNYLLMDSQYLNCGSPFERTLTMLATVISTRGDGHAVVDCGVKALSGERGLPSVKDMPSARVAALHAEHGLIEITTESAASLKIGQKIELWVHYGDGTINLHSSLFGVRHGQVEEVFTIEH